MGKKGKYSQRPDDETSKKKVLTISQQQLMDKTHMQPTSYIAYLPSDSLYPPFAVSEEQVGILRRMLKELNYTLYLDFKNFWATILYNPSFKICIHTCIQFFHRKWLNSYLQSQQQGKQNLRGSFNKIKDTPYFQYTSALMKVVLLIYYRIISFAQENEELSAIYNLKSQIVKKYILDVPRLLEIAEVYGASNPELVRGIVREFTNLSPTLYSDFKEEILEPLITRMGKNVTFIKKTTDREEFGATYSYTRAAGRQLSAGEEELKRKIGLLMECLGFYLTLNNLSLYWPVIWAESPCFNYEINCLSENLFIEVDQAYKIWDCHQQGETLYALMNCVMEMIVSYFVEFFERCEAMFVRREGSSGFKEAYMKCLERIIEGYGRRQSLGKKAFTTKRSMELYRQILKKYKLNEFIGKLYEDQFQNSTYGINVQYLIDFKLAIDEEVALMQNMSKKKQQVDIDINVDVTADGKQEDSKTNDEGLQEHDKKDELPQQQLQPNTVQPKSSQFENFDRLQFLISKRNRQDDYYENLSRAYHTKITDEYEYEDEYDEFVDYEKRPVLDDSESEDDGDDDDDNRQNADTQTTKPQFVGSEAGKRGGQYNERDRNNWKNRPKFVPAKKQVRQIITKEANRQKYNKNQKEKPVYIAKPTNLEETDNTERQEKEEGQWRQQSYIDTKKKMGDKEFDESKGYFIADREYNDEQCSQQCKQPPRQQQPERHKKYHRKDKQEEGGSEDDKTDNTKKGGKPGPKTSNNKSKGGNINKKPKYVTKY